MVIGINESVACADAKLPKSYHAGGIKFVVNIKQK
jgi:hypothetical protein